MMPADIDMQKLQLVCAVLFLTGLSGTLATALLQRFMRRWGWFLALLYALAVVGGMSLFSQPYALLLLVLCVCIGTPLLIGHMVQIEKEDGQADRNFSRALSEDRDAAS